MIQVRWELEGDEIDERSARIAVQKILDYCSSVLAEVSCPVHGGKPWLEVRGSAVKNLTVGIGSCCRLLFGITEERIRRVSRREGDHPG